MEIAGIRCVIHWNLRISALLIFVIIKHSGCLNKVMGDCSDDEIFDEGKMAS